MTNVQLAVNRDDARIAETSKVTDLVTQDLYPRFADRLEPESLEALVRAELSRWEQAKVRDFVPIFVGRRVRAQLAQFV